MNEEDYLKEVTNTETSMQYVKIGLDDSVLINGKWGILDFLGEDMIVIVGEDGKRHKLAYKDIKSCRRLQAFLVGNKTETTFRIDGDGMHECAEEEFETNFHEEEDTPLYDCIVEGEKGYFVLNNTNK
jgi:hypothetical protein